ncbi:hypothetical protein ACFQHO_53195 [Actinomadura yumaensis]|uniref:hypothetical protein n=1 Tax=Actinomadura yumaensis TaxID=111807 RepID=UPI0036072584
MHRRTQPLRCGGDLGVELLADLRKIRLDPDPDPRGLLGGLGRSARFRGEPGRVQLGADPRTDVLDLGVDTLLEPRTEPGKVRLDFQAELARLYRAPWDVTGHPRHPRNRARLNGPGGYGPAAPNVPTVTAL